jgi:hypothetical protein
MNRWEALAEIVRSFNAQGAVWLAFSTVVAAIALPIIGVLAVTYLTLE